MDFGETIQSTFNKLPIDGHLFSKILFIMEGQLITFHMHLQAYEYICGKNTPEVGLPDCSIKIIILIVVITRFLLIGLYSGSDRVLVSHQPYQCNVLLDWQKSIT